ncbi:hypothetical protein E2562_037570 [Oryza meyeriana var. granulata]|uniref:Uncharacterized protein n=1 Tax=Oryza meyeriana var. granulata TaxID=110450 RepID=A0A6G1CLT7_9ORYZ|nr:hypothetical protein E2562_037570 [Oryza meyeriana var. granulata]
MANTTSSAHSMGSAGFATQANVLLHKNICFQVPFLPSLFLPLFLLAVSRFGHKRNLKKNAWITGVLNHELNKPKYQRLTRHLPPTAAPSNCPPRAAAMEHGGQS